MTRNNLTEHITWLLQNAALAVPPPPSFPGASDPGSLEASQSQRSHPVSCPQSQSSLARVPLSGGGTALDGPAGSAHLSTRRGNDLPDTSEVTVEERKMARLTSTTKPKKSLLVSQLPQQLPTPSATSDGREKTRGQSTNSGGTWTVRRHIDIETWTDYDRASRNTPN